MQSSQPASLALPSPRSAGRSRLLPLHSAGQSCLGPGSGPSRKSSCRQRESMVVRRPARPAKPAPRAVGLPAGPVAGKRQAVAPLCSPERLPRCWSSFRQSSLPPWSGRARRQAGSAAAGVSLERAPAAPSIPEKLVRAYPRSWRSKSRGRCSRTSLAPAPETTPWRTGEC